MEVAERTDFPPNAYHQHEKEGLRMTQSGNPHSQAAKTSGLGVSLRDLQEKIRVMYFDKDQARGVDGTFMWLMEEVGELAAALRGNDRENLAEEFADVLAWLATIANVAGVDLSDAVGRKYGGGCPGCGLLVCTCPNEEKP
jgi:NTP pyrophosphatase (non-canonical NTP hydrolase)